jgi:23S rRNA (pseudouridine1915-N3)-methyltransferase
MRVLVAAVGKAPPGPERDLAERYRERAAKAGLVLGIRAVELKQIAESRARSAAERRASEASDLIRAAGEADVVALDGRGEHASSEDIAGLIDRARGAGRDLAFLIGGPDGHGEPALARAARRIAFGRATWPHLLVRAMLLEQLYRAMTILSGHPYHRA